MLAAEGEHADAADLMTQALELVPGWAAGWFCLADYEEKSGRKEAAVDALRKVLELNPDDIFGATLKLAFLNGAEAGSPSPSLHVERLFDDYAHRFDTSLVVKLGYSVPETLSALIWEHVGEAHLAYVTDLGCGTGLFGERIRARTDYLEGYDLSANMLAKAADKGVYDHLAQADLSLPPETSGLFANHKRHRASLVSAADVFLYLGNLDSAFILAGELLAEAGLFAFSVEDAGNDGDVVLRQSLRYAHSRDYVLRCCGVHGLTVLAIRETVIRNDGGNPVSGILFLARKSA
ncbi:putative TPR repeat methyltransferase [Rhizobium herbae]|uniref:TPR repeat methyltransferase n=2 Tax=Rhizobium herbae TaxID=508661 RepID=A0ABS4EJU3_9HYPH|nr:putative TPR repeat methyltransferase [Rhizobium herbae]